MADNSLSKMAQADNDFIAAYDERTRLFNALRNLNLTDERREELRKEYAAAAKKFDSLRSQIVK